MKTQLSEKELLEIQKLKQDLRHGRLGLILSVIGSAVLLVGLVIERSTAYQQRQADQELRERELRLAVFAQRREAYLALTDAVCAIAACRNYKEVEDASVEFKKLYYGRAHIIAEGDDEVINAKIEFNNALLKYLAEKPDEPPYRYFSGAAMAVTFACQPSIDPRLIKFK